MKVYKIKSEAWFRKNKTSSDSYSWRCPITNSYGYTTGIKSFNRDMIPFCNKIIKESDNIWTILKNGDLRVKFMKEYNGIQVEEVTRTFYKSWYDILIIPERTLRKINRRGGFILDEIIHN